MAELVDAVDSKSTGGDIVGVQVPLPVPLIILLVTGCALSVLIKKYQILLVQTPIKTNSINNTLSKKNCLIINHNKTKY